MASKITISKDYLDTLQYYAARIKEIAERLKVTETLLPNDADTLFEKSDQLEFFFRGINNSRNLNEN